MYNHTLKKQAQLQKRLNIQTYAVNFRSDHVTNSFSEVLGQVVVKSQPQTMQDLLFLALPYMPQDTRVIQISWFEPTLQNAFFKFSNGELVEFDGSEDWETYLSVPEYLYARFCAVNPFGSRVLKRFIPSLSEIKAMEESLKVEKE
jgi:hypothetical protein